MAIHAKLSASGAHRWMACPGSVSAEEGLPNTTSDAAEEGTAAHELAERCLIEEVTADYFLGITFNGFVVDQEMAEAVQTYLDYVLNLPGGHRIEQRVDLSFWIPGGFGTADFISVNDTEITVVDLKYGKGIRVDAYENSQGMMYALGAQRGLGLSGYLRLEKVKVVIVQPRLDHISEYEISPKALLTWGESVREYAAEALQDDAPRLPSLTACQWCRAKGTCEALAKKCNRTVGMEAGIPVPHGELSNDEIADTLPTLPLIKSWIKAVEEHALDAAVRGEIIPGYKVVRGTSRRAWDDEALVTKSMKNAKVRVGEMFTKKLVSPAQAEKLLGKGHRILQVHSIKPEGKPTLVLEEDKRPAIESAAAGFEPVNTTTTIT